MPTAWLNLVLAGFLVFGVSGGVWAQNQPSNPTASGVETVQPPKSDSWMSAVTPDLSGLNQQFTQLSQGVSQVRNSVSESTSELVLNAMDFLGVPYKKGGNSAETGFDCSGFVRSVYESTLGTVLPRRAAEQAQQTQKIAKEELRPGDLVFFNTMRRAFSHVGIYVGDGKFIHSPRAGGKVRVEDMRESYWTKRFNGARRVAGGEISGQTLNEYTTPR